MPTGELNSPLITGQAGVANEWGSAGIQGQALAAIKAQLDHGINIELELGALVGLDASFSKFITADVQGEAHAALNATVQIQVPMNLFEEVGVAVRLRIAAEAAAGVTLQLGLNVGDFLSLVDGQVGPDSLEARLFRIFLDEATIGGGVYAKVAASAMAYATLAVAGRAIKGDRPGEDPGFSIIAEAGAGLKAGAGFRVFFRAGIDNFPRFIGRSTDLLVDERLAAMVRLMPAGAPETRVLAALQAPAKIAFRLAFEMGHLIASEPVPVTADGGRKISLRACQVILEESQRYLLDRIVGGAVDEIRRQLEARLNALNPSARQSAMPAIEAFGRQLVAIPAEPLRAENAAWWISTVDASAAALAAVTPGSQDALKPAALLWSAIELLAVAMRRINEPSARASFNVAGLRTGQARKSFSGPTTTNPPNTLRPTLEQLTGTVAGAPLRQQDLVQLLVDEGLALAQQSFPEVNDFLAIFQGLLGDTVSRTAEQLLGSFGGMVAGSSGANDEDATLAAFLAGLRDFLDAEIEGRLAPVLRSQLAGQAQLITELDEVLLPSLHLTVDNALPQLLRWKSGTVDQSSLKQIFSSVLMTLAGRTLIVTADILSATAEERMRELLTSAADGIQASHLAGRLQDALPPGVNIDLHDLEDLIEEGLRVGAEVISPIPSDTRVRIRGLLYEIINTLPAGDSASFQDRLRMAGFIPNEAKIRALATELGTIAAARLKLFAELILLRVAEWLLEELLAVINAIEVQVAQWLGQIGALIDQLRRDIDRLLAEAGALLQQATAAFDGARAQMISLLECLGNTNSRNAFLNEFETAVYDLATRLLYDNPVYAVMPSDVKRRARDAARAAIRTLVRNSIVETILGAIGDLATEVDEIFADVRTLDPHDGLTSGILNLLLDRIERRVRDAAGGTEEFSIGFTVSWSVDYWTYDVFHKRWDKHTNHFSERIELDRVHWDLDGLLPLLRRTINKLAFVEQQLTGIANALLTAISLEAQAAQRDAQRSQKQAARDAATHVQDESSCIPTRIEILSPLQSALYEGSLSVHVRLPDTPASFIGAGGSEEQRVHIWLNSEEISRNEFTVDSLLGLMATRVIQPGQVLGRWTPKAVTVRPAPAPARMNGRAVPGIARPVPHIGKPLGVRPPPPAITGISITIPLSADRLEDGVNTLVVAVVNGRGQRVAHSVSFLASAPLTPKIEISQPRLGDLNLRREPGPVPIKPEKKALVTPHAVRQKRLAEMTRRLAARAVRFTELDRGDMPPC